MPASRDRLDKLLVARGLASSRERARGLIMAGSVLVDGRRVDKAGTIVPADAAIDVSGNDLPFVSRGGLKLAAALDHWQIDVQGAVAVDIGASTGGFTDCLLQRGAARVYAIDVGYGQLAWSLRQDPRVHLFERSNVRLFDPAQLAERADIAVIDVSFISLELVLPTALALVKEGAVVLPMVKPQFEVGKGQVGKSGVVRDEALRQAAAAKVRDRALELGAECLGQLDSPTPGPKGNVEIFLYLRHSREDEDPQPRAVLR